MIVSRMKTLKTLIKKKKKIDFPGGTKPKQKGLAKLKILIVNARTLTNFPEELNDVYHIYCN